jgi:hypothetical protein
MLSRLLVQAYESGSGKKLHVERLGSLNDLDARIEQLKQAGQRQRSGERSESGGLL